MEKELRKRLDEAARKFKGTYLENLNIVRELKGKRPLSADDGLIDLCLDVAELAYKEGAEWMFKEVGGETVLKEMRQTILGQCKEWIRKNVPIIHTEDGDYVRVNMGHKNVPLTIYLADFETDMNKLWEEQK